MRGIVKNAEQDNYLFLEAEAMADGYLPSERVKALNHQFHTQTTALSRMLAVARVNAELRKSRLTAYRDLSLAREINRLHSCRSERSR